MKTGRGLAIAGILAAVLLAGSAGFIASGAPDGLNRVALDHGFDDREVEPSGGLLPDYSVPGIENEYVSTGLAGLIGVGVVGAIGLGAGRLLRRPRRDEPTSSSGGPRSPASRV